MKKGQVTVEFLLLLLVMLLYVQTIIQPNIQITAAAAQDVSNVGRGVAELQKFYNAVLDVSNSGGDAKRTATLFIPPETTFTCSDSSAKVEILLSDTLSSYPVSSLSCNSGTNACTKEISLTSLGVICSESITGPVAKSLKIEKTGNTVNVS
ncbi:MAG: hypothetical protein V1494_02490 [Candidatus Diapherotrites archaeon]